MAKATATELKKEKDEKSKGGPSRKSYLKSMVSKGAGGRHHGQHTKYGDIDPIKVHEGDSTYRDNTITDSPSSSINHYAVGVKRGHGKNYFRFQGRLYHITHPMGMTHESVPL